MFFGPARDWAKTDSTPFELPEGSRVVDLAAGLKREFPLAAEGWRTVRFAVNESFVRADHMLQPEDRVAVIPPVTGGSEDPRARVELVKGPIPTDELRRFVGGDSRFGGVVTFEGVTRDDTHEEHGRLVRLEYESYATMADRAMYRLADEARSRWNLGRVALVHRLGAVQPGEVSVMIAVAARHRAEAFEACRWLIDALKKEVPIWKKDVFEDGFTRWVKPEESCRCGQDGVEHAHK